MAETCPTCGLPLDLCVCGTIAKEEAKIRIYIVRRRYGKAVTVIEGIEKKANPRKILKTLKAKLAAGGTYKEGRIELQGDHKEKAKKVLIASGFSEKQIEVE